MQWRARVVLLLVCLFFVPGCMRAARVDAGSVTAERQATLAHRLKQLGPGLQFYNDPKALPADATNPEHGARFSYDRSFSANKRKSPVGIEIWVFDGAGKPLHGRYDAYLRRIYRDIYAWRSDQWLRRLGDGTAAARILRTKSDLFWESLAQQVAERIFNKALSPALYRFGPHCLTAPKLCVDPGLAGAARVVVRTSIDGRRDPINPVTRSIVYDAARDDMDHPELILELDLAPLRVAGPHKERVDYRPLLGHDKLGAKKVRALRLRALLPRGCRRRTRNEDYPDYNLLLVPLRHLAWQGRLENPKDSSLGKTYPDARRLIQKVGEVLAALRTPAGGAAIAVRLRPFITSDYYYMFEEGGQGIESYASYILGTKAGVARGLNPDFGRVELEINHRETAVFAAPKPIVRPCTVRR